jgi:spore cortex biosynthesis protein YabQ
MISSIEAQFVFMIISVFAGLSVGILFDLYRTINYYTKPPKLLTHIMDLLFWVVTGCLVFFILLRADFARLRVYTFMGMGLGIFIYLKLFSEYILKLYRLIFYVAGKIIRIFLIILSMPFKLMYNLLWTPVNFISKTVKIGVKRSKGMASSIFKHFKRKK